MTTTTVALDTAVGPAVLRAWAVERTVYIELYDGRIIGFPADRYRILSQASNEQLAQVQIERDGHALRWEEVDEELMVPGIVANSFELPPR